MVPTCSVVGDIERTGAIEDIVEDSRKWIVTPSNDSSQYYKCRTRVPPPHPLESLDSSQVPLTPIWPPLAYVDVFVEDLIKVVQGWFNCI